MAPFLRVSGNCGKRGKGAIKKIFALVCHCLEAGQEPCQARFAASDHLLKRQSWSSKAAFAPSPALGRRPAGSVPPRSTISAPSSNERLQVTYTFVQRPVTV